MILIRSILLLASFLLSGLFYSQTNVTMTLPVVTLMDIEPTGSFALNFTAPTEAGNAIGNPTPNTSKWINYTSAIAPGGLTRRITASVNKVIAGVNIRVQAAAATGAGGGTLGTSAGVITLSTTATTIISGIGGAYTGNGSSNGHLLTVSLTTNTYANLIAQANTAVVITYTITE
ncbi:hypothetical protein CLU97_0087 [Chryseobacterium sp. 7]|uniref:hypothetical protein n=1 Tax=Chryseobacterium sp. 7 TaxID=2035214 RepID=UPI000EAC97A0|nr:hypothetical protein [Chryseobacterium sp. 7]RLJ30704.1 hypothetical protein CLU97_0087 [Chryseobacterium sp. 7]